MTDVVEGPRGWALVQGASRGLGLAFVRALLAGASVDGVLATCREPELAPDLQTLAAAYPDSLRLAALDVTDEASIEAAARASEVGAGEPLAGPLTLVINAAGVLHDGPIGPEKRLADVDPEHVQRVFQVNALGPLLVTKHFAGRFDRRRRAVIANLSARVGSIGDNRLGGWYAYRASKAAQNMFTRTLAIEFSRRYPRAVCVALHPGTVDTALSAPFQRNVSATQLVTPDRAAENLLTVIDGLSAEDSGGFFAWDGTPIPW